MNPSFRILFSILFVTTVTGCTSAIPTPVAPEHVSNQFQAVWNEVIVDPVKQLPQDTVSYKKLVAGGKNIILGDAKRTLNQHANILKPFNKLAHPNGVCFKGTWDIHADTRYSGYFKKNSKALIIVRASSALSNTRQGEIRSFGFAGKIFPTMNPQQILQENTANFFLIDDLGGTRAKHYTDVALSNEPTVDINSEVFKNLLYAAKLASTFSKADSHPKIRQLYEISQLGEANHNAVITPRWMKVEAKAGQTVDAKDFRNELSITNNKKLIFNVSIANIKVDDKKVWKNIGTITLDTSVVSTSCDHRLHFHHPVWKPNLKH